MATTASPSLSQALGRAAKILRLLEQAGMTDDDFQRIINDNALRYRFVEAWRSITVDSPELIAVPDKPAKSGIQRLLMVALKDYPGMTFGSLPLLSSNAFERLKMNFGRNGVLKELIDGRVKVPRDASVLVLRYGLESGEPKTLTEVGEYFGIGGSRVRELEQRALSYISYLIRQEFLACHEQCVTELIANGHHPIEELDDDEGDGRANHSMWLKNYDVYTIEQLVCLTKAQVLEMMNNHPGAVEDIKERLASFGLSLKDA